MQNQENNFKILIEKACDVLGLSYQELKEKYKDYPHCLMDYIENGISDPGIEVRFDEQLATLSLNFDDDSSCIASFLFFDHLTDEDSFVVYLNKDIPYDFKRSRWTMKDYEIEVKPYIYNMAFFFHK